MFCWGKNFVRYSFRSNPHCFFSKWKAKEHSQEAFRSIQQCLCTGVIPEVGTRTVFQVPRNLVDLVWALLPPWPQEMVE